MLRPGGPAAEVDARSVNREDAIKGAEILGVELDEHIPFVMEAMKEATDELDLRGTA